MKFLEFLYRMKNGFLNLLNPSRLENELKIEVESHLDREMENNLRNGATEAEARNISAKQFGHVESLKEECRDSWGVRTVQNIVQDLRYALRQMKKTPGFVAVIILTLALGIGSVTTIFSMAYSLLIKPLPYPHPEELLVVFESQKSKSRFSGYVAPATFLHWREKATDFESMGMRGSFTGNVFGTGLSFQAHTFTLTANYFSMLGVQPMLGRNFRPDENSAEKSNVMILSHRIWQSQFAENPDVIGQTLLLDKASFTIIGVMPKSFQLYPRADIYTPITLTAKSPSDYDRQQLYVVMGRMKPGVSEAQAATQLNTIIGQLAITYPDTYEGSSAGVLLLNKLETEDGGPILSLLLGAVGCLLLITCINIANLLLARSGVRQAEIAVRSALGAGRGRIFRQLLSESLLLAGIGGVLGIMVGYWGLNIVVSHLPAFVHHLDQIKMDGGVLAFTCLLTVFTGVTFGLVPALRASRVDLNTALKDGGRLGVSSSKSTHRLRNCLVVAQVALALVLLSGGGLFIRSILKMQHIDVGYETKTTYLTSILFSEQKYPTPRLQLNLINHLTEAISQVHGIETAAFTNHTHPGSKAPRAKYSIVGSTDGESEQRAPLIYYGVSRDYFNTLHIPLIKGRLFNERDSLGSPRVALINEGMAQTIFAGKDPIGQMIVLQNDKSEIPREVIGVVANTYLSHKQDPNQPQFYEPYEQTPGASTTLILRTDGTPLDFKALNAAVHAVDADVPILTMINIRERMNSALKLIRVIVSLYGTFSLIALLLASIGIYGVMTYSVTQRRYEIGIRIALGAQPSDIMKLVFRHSGKLLLIGLIIGLAGALGLAQLLRSQLYNTSPHDPLTYAVITLIFALVAFLACFIPAQRATKIDPMVALRSE